MLAVRHEEGQETRIFRRLSRRIGIGKVDLTGQKWKVGIVVVVVVVVVVAGEEKQSGTLTMRRGRKILLSDLSPSFPLDSSLL